MTNYNIHFKEADFKKGEEWKKVAEKRIEDAIAPYNGSIVHFSEYIPVVIVSLDVSKVNDEKAIMGELESKLFAQKIEREGGPFTIPS